MVAAFAVVAVAALAFALPKTQREVVNPGAFTLKRTLTRTLPNGEVQTRREIYRRSSDGSFRIIETDGNTIFYDRGFQQGRGFYVVNYKDHVLERNSEEAATRESLYYTTDAWSQDPHFIRTEQILGRTAYMIRAFNNDGSISNEDWFAADTGGMPLRSIMYRGGRPSLVAEPYSLELGEPPAEFVRLPDFTEKSAQMHSQ